MCCTVLRRSTFDLSWASEQNCLLSSVSYCRRVTSSLVLSPVRHIFDGVWGLSFKKVIVKDVMLNIIRRNNDHYSLCFSHLMAEPERMLQRLLYLRLSVANAIMAKHELMNKIR